MFMMYNLKGSLHITGFQSDFAKKTFLNSKIGLIFHLVESLLDGKIDL